MPPVSHIQWGEGQMNRVIAGGKHRIGEGPVSSRLLRQPALWGVLGPVSLSEMGVGGDGGAEHALPQK